MYTCQLFQPQRREIFILGVSGFSKTTRLHPKISEDVPNNCEVLKNQRFQGKYRDLLILYGLFVSRVGLSLHIFGKCVS